MVLLIDNYDSFTWNIAHRIGELGAPVTVMRNDAITLDEIDALSPDRIVISPGPGRPEAAGISVDVIRKYAGRLPILGVCLGHQAIAVAFGGRVEPAPVPMHGKTSLVEHDGQHVFAELSSPFEAGRYHSLVVPRDQLPDALVVSAWVGNGGPVMGLRHKTLPVFGVQFHPESVLTAVGHRLLQNFLESR